MNKRKFTTYLLYFLVCSILLSTQWVWNASPRTYVEPILDPLYALYEVSTDTYRNTTLFFRDRGKLIDRLRNLKQQNRSLRQEVYEGKAARRENKQLRQYLNLPTTGKLSIKPAEILQRNLSGWEQTLRVNRGSEDGYRTNQLALQIRGDSWVVRGKVFSTSEDHSVIVLSSDPRFKIGVRLRGVLGRQFVARGWGYRGLRIEHFPRFLNVEPEAQVYTAPSSVISPREFYVGRVTGIEMQSETQVGRRIRIKPPELTNRRVIWVVTADD